MKLKYLQTAAFGLKWMRRYYRKNPQLNQKAASLAMKEAEKTLISFMRVGERYEDFENIREYPIPGTAFSFLYTVINDTIWIIDIRDPRGNRSAEALRQFSKEFRHKL